MSRIFKRGQFWYIDFEYKGRRYRKSLETRSKQVAELALKDTDVKIAKERLDLAPPEDIHFEDFARKFLDWYRVQNSEKSYIDYRNLFNSTLIPYYSGLLLKEIDTEMIEEYKLNRAEDISASTVNKELVALRHLFNKAILWRYMNLNPVKDVKKLRVKQRKVRFLTIEEVHQVLSVCPKHLKPVFLTALHTGMRKSELFRLEWEDIDFERRCIIVCNKEESHTKNYSNREIPMTDELFNTLKNLYESSSNSTDYIFLKRDGKPHQGNLRKTISFILRQTGIMPFTLHDLRHTFASHLVMEGIDLRTIQKFMGHGNISTTMIYAHLAPDHMRNAIDRYGNRLNNYSKQQT